MSHPLATLEGEVNRDEERLDDLQVGFTSYHHYDHDDCDHDIDVDNEDYDDMILLQSELESNFSARICERLERLQVAGNASQVIRIVINIHRHHHQHDHLIIFIISIMMMIRRIGSRRLAGWRRRDEGLPPGGRS